MSLSTAGRPQVRSSLRTALSHDVTNGLSVALGLLLISGGVHLWLGAAAAASAATGVIVASPPDRAAPRRGKLRQLLPAALLSLPLFFAVQMLHTMPGRLGLLLVPASFLAFLAMAWGKRGIPIAIALMLAMVFSMATRPPSGLGEALARTGHMALGSALYVVYATLMNLVLNARYRTQYMADLLLSMAGLMRAQARQFRARDESSDVREVDAPALGAMLRAQAALADQLQSTRDLVFESPRTPYRQRLAGMLMTVLEMRDHLLASELDLETLRSHPRHGAQLAAMRQALEAMADDVEALADALLQMRRPAVIADRRQALAAIPADADETAAFGGPSPGQLARGLANRLAHLNDETVRLARLARGDEAPDLAVVRAHWQVFVSPTEWSIRPFLALWRWDAPPLRHAIRAALALATGYVIAVLMPWGSHDYWILLTIVVVLRGSLAQTLERRNQRVAGTLVGSLFAVALLATHPGPVELLLAMTAAQAFAHGFAVRKYTLTAVAATVLGLVQAHQLYAGAAPTFALGERIADTLIGAALAWAFCYVLPSWERTQIPALVRRTVAAQARHARLSLSLGQLHALETAPELEWRLARREAFDALSALVQATQRSLSEPRAVQPPLEPLERLQAHSYQLLAQLSSVKSMLVLRHDRLTPSQVQGPLERAARRIDEAIGPRPAGAPERAEPADAPDAAPAASLSSGPVPLPDPFDQDISPWLLRRLDLAAGIAMQIRTDVAQILRDPAMLPAGPSQQPRSA
ncbi:FUSC family protein [Pseudacidovorax sp. NFM-22]|uniref:FUSC family protein n=1 Tax=Pseudacidovorax sp. NFM-22 TaxID=2744469 RepID=UPI001F3AE1AF|nr:FUSC family membrane protein [uncultured Pseudacidovorax sp.]